MRFRGKVGVLQHPHPLDWRSPVTHDNQGRSKMHWILAVGIHGGLLTQLGTFNNAQECNNAMRVVFKLMDPNKHGEVACLPDNDPETATFIRPKS